MIAVEVIVALMVVAVIIVGIVKVAGPIADAFSDRLKLKFQELGPEQERQFRQRIDALEEQVRDLRTQVSDLQASVKFKSDLETDDSSNRIKLNQSVKEPKR
ncbi:MAG TPA: hypothetical protein V6C76_03215 [Drouetiella sp.]